MGASSDLHFSVTRMSGPSKAGFQSSKQLFRHPVTNEYLWKYGKKEYFPNIRMGLMRSKNPQNPVLTLRTDPKHNKFEIKQMLTSVYGFHVKKVNTLNYEPALGHHHAPGPARKGKRYKKRAGFKKAYISLSDTPVNSIIYKMKEHAEDMDTIADHFQQQQLDQTPASGEKIFLNTPRHFT